MTKSTPCDLNLWLQSSNQFITESKLTVKPNVKVFPVSIVFTGTGCLYKEKDGRPENITPPVLNVPDTEAYKV